MKYASAAALDRAITDVRLRQVGGDAGRYQQLRREVAFERVLARILLGRYRPVLGRDF